MPPRFAESLCPPEPPNESRCDPPWDPLCEPLCDPLSPPDPLLDPPVLPVLLERPWDPLLELEPERDPLPEFADPLMSPLDPLELPDEPDAPWSFLLFAILPPALFGRT